jgi:hypothetical protein
MASLGRILSRTFFWSYERGSWQYDVAVILILVFVLLTPRRWFRDLPQVGMPTGTTPVVFVPSGGDGQTEVYRVDARAIAPPERTPALANELHNALQKSVKDLNDGRFAIGKIEAVRDDQGIVIAYRVEIRH